MLAAGHFYIFVDASLCAVKTNTRRGKSQKGRPGCKYRYVYQLYVHEDCAGEKKVFLKTL